MIRAAAVALGLACAVFWFPARAELAEVDDVPAAFAARRFDEIEALYARVVRERRRGPDGKFLFEEFLFSLPWYSDDDPNGASYWPQVDAATSGWVAHSPRSHLAAMVRAHVLARRANHLSATGAWNQVDARVAEARRLLAGTRAQGERDANWHAVRLRVIGVEGVPREDVLDAIHAAVAVDPYPLRVWQYAAFSLSPDGRSIDDLRWLMRLAVQRTAQREGTTMYARVLENVYWHFPAFRAGPFSRGGLDWKVLDASFEEWRTRYPASYPVDFHAALACDAFDQRVTGRLLAEIGSHPRVDVWESIGGKGFLERCRERATVTPPAPKT